MPSRADRWKEALTAAFPEYRFDVLTVGPDEIEILSDEYPDRGFSGMIRLLQTVDPCTVTCSLSARG